jgi:KEOPS complex subunit Pcc1
VKIKSNLRLEFKLGSDNAQIFYTSFIPEFSDMPMKRSKWKIFPPEKQNDSEVVIFEIESEDAVAFRATINSIIQFAHIIEKTVTMAIV